MKTHTPGPWHVASDPGGTIVTNLIGPIVARVSNTANAQADANAQLIAAAPNLLDALVSLLEAVQLNQISPTRIHSTDVEERALKAIAKAKGEK